MWQCCAHGARLHSFTAVRLMVGQVQHSTGWWRWRTHVFIFPPKSFLRVKIFRLPSDSWNPQGVAEVDIRCFFLLPIFALGHNIFHPSHLRPTVVADWIGWVHCFLWFPFHSLIYTPFQLFSREYISFMLHFSCFPAQGGFRWLWHRDIFICPIQDIGHRDILIYPIQDIGFIYPIPNTGDIYRIYLPNIGGVPDLYCTLIEEGGGKQISLEQ